MNTAENLLTPRQVAQRLGLSRTWVYAHLALGTISALRVGRFYWIDPAEVARIRKEGLPPLARGGKRTSLGPLA